MAGIWTVVSDIIYAIPRSGMTCIHTGLQVSGIWYILNDQGEFIDQLKSISSISVCECFENQGHLLIIIS